MPPQLKDAAELGWGRGAHTDLSSSSLSLEGGDLGCRGELSRVGVEGEASGVGVGLGVMRGRCGCLDLSLLFKGYEECCLFSLSLPPPPEL